MTDSPEHSSHKEALRYISLGQHAFIASDEPAERDLFVTNLCGVLADNPVRVVDASETTSNRDFADQTAAACLGLLHSVNSGLSSEPCGLSDLLRQTFAGFRKESRQGFLIFNHMDSVICRQNSFEVEAPFREVMQFSEDVAVVWLASRETILTIGRPDRPFYLSHRCFGI